MNKALVELLETSRDLGFLGPSPVEDQIARAEAFATALPQPPARALDLGAGGGLPGLVLAALGWPDTQWTFLDAQARRTAFLTEAVETLGLEGRVSVLTERAELTGRHTDHRGRYDLVVSRSFGRPAVTAECASPLLAVGGWLVVSEPPESDPAERWPVEGMAMLGLGSAEAITVTYTDQTAISSLNIIDPPGPDSDPVESTSGFDGLLVTHLVRMRQAEPTDDRYPRRVGMPAKRPLF